MSLKRKRSAPNYASRNPRAFHIDLRGISVLRDLILTGISGKSAGEHALAIDNAIVQGSLLAAENDFMGDVSLDGARIGRLVDDPDTGWRGAPNLTCNEFLVERMTVPPEAVRPLWKSRAAWLRRNKTDDSKFSNQPWRVCATAYERAGLYSDARRLNREEKREENRKRVFWKQPFVWLLAEIPFGYGLSATRAGATALLFWALGTAGTQFALSRGQLTSFENGQATKCEALAALYALDVALPVVDLGEERECKPGLAPQHANSWDGIDIPGTDQTLFEERALWNWARAAYAVLGAIIAGFSILTWTGVFKPKAQAI